MKFVIILLFLSIAVVLTGCLNGTANDSEQVDGYLLAWDSKDSPRLEWSKTILTTVDSEFQKLSEAKDMNEVCPNFHLLDSDEQKMVFGELIVAMAFYESSWKPTSWMVESTMRKDCVTGRQIRSEGLMQMSYCDTTWAKFCEFDWSKDKNLDENDPKKTIFDPHKNLRCAIKVLANQTNNHKKLRLGRGKQYWAVILDGGKYDKTPQIKERILKRIPKCKPTSK